MDKVYYINVDVRDKNYYGEVVTLFMYKEHLNDLCNIIYKVKLKNEKYIQNKSEDDRYFEVYASNIIYLEEN